MTTFPRLQVCRQDACCLSLLCAFDRVVLVLGACLLLAGLSPVAAQAQGEPSRPRQAVAVQLAWKYQFEFAPFIAALEKGYYREAGLDVVLREWSPGVDVGQEVSAGRADFGTLDSALIVERAKGRPLVALAALLQHSPVGLLARRQTGIDSVGDLAGKRVGTSHGTADEILAYLAASALPPTTFRHVPDIGDGRRALLADQVDAVGVFIGDDVIRELANSGDYLLLLPRSAAIDLYGTLLLTSESVLASQASMVRAFRSATLKGLDYALEHPEDVVDLILARYNTQKRSREQLLFEARQIRDLARPPGIKPGAMSIARWQHIVDVYTGQGKLEPGTDLLGFVYDPDAGSLGPFVPWLLGGGLLGLLIVGWGVRKFLERRT